MGTKKNQSLSFVRVPIVAVLGHVDHGKTTLLDSIRSARVADSEAGHITQSIGAYQITISGKTPEENRQITFIDTPGHEAFAKIRSRGAQLADIAVLVVAADDGVMPQTIESIKKIQEADIPYVVAINKIDMPGANAKKVSQQLAQHNVLVEKLGGEVVVVELSAKTGQNIKQLLEVIILLSEMKGLQGTPTDPFLAVSIDTRRDTHRGAIVDMIIKSGTIAVGDTVYSEGVAAKVRALFNDQGKSIAKASAGMPVELLGFTDAPAVGAVIRSTQGQKGSVQLSSEPTSLEDRIAFFLSQENKGLLKIILRADTAGSLEALKENLPKEVMIISSGVGEITKSDVQQAVASKAVIIGFNTKASSSVTKEAAQEGIRMKTYTIIYEMLQEIGDVVEMLKNPESTEETLGEAQIIAEFPFENSRIAGCKVVAGRVVRADTIRLMRAGSEIGATKIRTLQQGKNKVDKVEQGSECGILLDKKLDFRPGDSIIAYKIKASL